MTTHSAATEIAKMASAGVLVAETIAYLGEQLEPRITTGELDRTAAALDASRGGTAAAALGAVGDQLGPGLTPGELDRLAEELIESRGGTPTSKGYRGFPAAICI